MTDRITVELTPNSRTAKHLGWTGFVSILSSDDPSAAPTRLVCIVRRCETNERRDTSYIDFPQIGKVSLTDLDVARAKILKKLEELGGQP